MKQAGDNLIAAVFTPMRDDGEIDLDRVNPIVERLASDGVGGIFVCGSTGEGPSLSIAERRATAEAYLRAATGRLRVIVHVGHDSLTEARALATHAQSIGADSISAVPPSYFKPSSLEMLVRSLELITEGAPDLPFYYYHIPRFTGVHFEMAEFLRLGAERLPRLAGVKFSDLAPNELRRSLEVAEERFEVLFGVDEELLTGLELGVHGAVGSTYNFAAPHYLKIMSCVESGDLEEAGRLQAQARRMVEIVSSRGVAGLNATKALSGLECGPNRLPIESLQPTERESLRAELEQIGFFEWSRR